MSSKEKILLVAQEMFYRNGYLATSVDDIIREAGVSKSNFYYHFKSKEDLGIVVLEVRKEDLQAFIDRTLRNQELNRKARLLRFFESLTEWQESRLNQGGCPFGNLIAEMSEHSERFRCELSRTFDQLTSLIADIVAEGQRYAEFRKDIDPIDVANLIIQATQGMQLMAKCHKRTEAYGRSTRLLIKLIEVS